MTTVGPRADDQDHSTPNRPDGRPRGLLVVVPLLPTHAEGYRIVAKPTPIYFQVSAFSTQVPKWS
jgi:hypothetical protein